MTVITELSDLRNHRPKKSQIGHNLNSIKIILVKPCIDRMPNWNKI